MGWGMLGISVAFSGANLPRLAANPPDRFRAVCPFRGFFRWVEALYNANA